MNCIVSKWVFEDPLWTLFGSLLLSKRFLGQIQSKFLSKASCNPMSLQGIVLWFLPCLYQQPLHVSQAY
jgi:hypothetical protein